MKRDYLLVIIIGFLVGWLVLLPLKNVGVELSSKLIAASVIFFTAFAPLALFILKLLGRVWHVFEQFGKFAAVGTLDTLLDLGVLNLLISLTNLAVGLPFVGFKAISFLIVVTNSYFWNKFWTFEHKMPVRAAEYTRFLFFTLIGAVLNVGVASFIVNVIGAPAGLNERLWANIGALIAVFVAFSWNFLTYRKIIFKQQEKV